MKSKLPSHPSKLPDVGTTIFTVMSRLAQECGAINLSQGFPDFDPHPDLVSMVSRAMERGVNQYSPMSGRPALREKIAAKVEKLYRVTYDPGTEVNVTSGASQAIFGILTSFVRPGDEVIVFEPFYDLYVPGIELHGGKALYSPLVPPNYRIDWDHVASLITEKTKMIILNSPHNPTGAVMTEEDMKRLSELVADTDIMILSDEVYEHIVFDNASHQSVISYPELAQRSFVVFSFGKTYHVTGWKVGYCLAPADLMAEFRKVHQYDTFCTASPIQAGIAEFMDREDEYLGLGEFYQEKRDLFLKVIEGSRLKAVPTEGTYFQMVDYSAVSDEGDVEFARKMTREYGVAAIPPSVFYHDGADHKVLRFCFAKRNETLEKAGEKLCKI